MENTREEICIVGAGLVGSLLSIYLGQRGFKVNVYEKRNDPRLDFNQRGRTIAMSLSERGLKALEEIGLDEIVKEFAVPSAGRMIHLESGILQEQLYSDGSNAIYTINRNKLNTTLIDFAENTGNVNFHFNHLCMDIDFKSNQLKFIKMGSAEPICISYKILFGTDGAFSDVRKAMINNGISDFTNLTLDYGYKEIKIPVNANEQYALSSNHVHVWPRKNCFLIAFPNAEKFFACTLFLPLKGEISFESINDDKSVEDFFSLNFPELIQLVPGYKTEFINNPVSKLVVTSGSPWSDSSKVLLLGDSSHAITPFYGMGMNTGFEDCSLFIELLEQNNFNFEKTISGFEALRKHDTDAMSELSLMNFSNINNSSNLDYQTKWLLERRIWKLFPRSWIPAYVMIVFSHIPFSKVKRKIEKQNKIINHIIKKEPEVLSLCDKELKSIVCSYLMNNSHKYELSE